MGRCSTNHSAHSLAPWADAQPTTVPIHMQLHNLMRQLNSSITSSKRNTYNRAWYLVEECMSSVCSTTSSLPLTANHMSLFVAYLYQKYMARPSIATYWSAVGYLHKLHNLHDPTDTFLVHKLVAGLTFLMFGYPSPATYSNVLFHRLRLDSLLIIIGIYFQSCF